MSIRTALLVVDLQPDFMPGGALPVAEGDQLVSPIRDLLMSGRFDVVVATQDWHPPGHVSFASSHAGMAPYDTTTLYGHEQVLWPDHCVQGTAGAALHEGLPLEWVDAIIRKGNDPAVDSYSGFRNNWNVMGDRPPTGLAGLLKERGTTHLLVCGLARDYCVKWTAEDAAEAGFKVRLLWDLTRPVDRTSDDRVREALTAKGVAIVSE
ncbi:MAG: bifunctional nicotinamidase/pyrazinamidase [Gemmatimonadota bacterium]|nr:bifunctional nicotinamidase/pyrazinamidase [Gemmatimonadota bacterium]